MKEFKIYPEYGKLCFGVKLFDTNKEMREYAYKYFGSWHSGGMKALKSAGALTIPFTAYSKDDVLLPLLGYILLSKKYMGPKVLAHEASHAAIIYATRKGLSPEKIFYGDDYPVEGYTKPGRPGDVPHVEEVFNSQHERFCLLQTYMFEQLVEKTKNVE